MGCEIVRLLAAGAAALVLAAAGSASADTNIWSTSFDSGYFETLGPFPHGSMGVSFGGGSIVGSESLPGFGTNYFRNGTTGTTTFSASGLGAHSALHLSFDLAFLDSWDGFLPPGNCCSPDVLTVAPDGVAPLSLTWNGGNGASPAVFGPGTVVGTGYYAVNGSWPDAVVHYDFIIPTSASVWSMSISAGGAGWQGGDDESWGIDNFHLGAITATKSATPEPAAWTMMILGFGAAGSLLRRRRSAIA